MMADVLAIVLVRGKTPPAETVQLAENERIPLISTPYGMFEACGILYQAGLSCLERPVSDQDCFVQLIYYQFGHARTNPSSKIQPHQ